MSLQEYYEIEIALALEQEPPCLDPKSPKAEVIWWICRGMGSALAGLAIWKDGTQYVGTSERPLTEELNVLDDARRAIVRRVCG